MSDRTDDWHALADRVAGQVRDYLDTTRATARGEHDGEAIPLLLLQVSQILLAGAQLGASRDVILPGNWEPDVGEDPDLDDLRQGLAKVLAPVDTYGELFDPYTDSQGTAYRLSDDIADVASDLIHGLRHYDAQRPHEALWWWQYSYFNHWGNHAGAAMRALHAVIAHARLDVAPEPTDA
ncbi:DUF5063 domain-containing protein [Allonocardiopsis opalescens]|uniref:Uncharacterized protein DUF5063 n=1 Tax=Allonocardiopsis opalescens TaxID=1144618 RepID=A0A2T0Q6R3_9ACTN|nr:DUF5063 domain-containing protein [Allonocardiopsis opalescens]PRX99508.1 uncharacterized protein DUF5063 [Allonocardiopsis opalescens]